MLEAWKDDHTCPESWNCGGNTFFPEPHVRETQMPDCNDQQLFTQAILETSAHFETREVGFSFIGNSSESSFCLVGKLNYTYTLFL